MLALAIFLSKMLTPYNTGTYQEGMLSRRRLIFNQSYLAFQRL